MSKKLSIAARAKRAGVSYSKYYGDHVNKTYSTLKRFKSFWKKRGKG